MHCSFPGILLVLGMLWGGCTGPRLLLHPEVSYAYAPVQQQLRADTGLASFLAPYRLGMDKVMNKVVGYAGVPMTKGQPECTLGNFLADAQLLAAQKRVPATRISILNYGAIRIPYIPQGPLTTGKIYELMPFDNKLVIMEIPGTVLQQFCDHMAQYGGWPVSGLSFRIRDKKAVEIKIEGQMLEDHQVYITALSDFLADGGDHCTFLAGCKKQVFPLLVRDLLLEHIEEDYVQGDTLKPVIEKRIIHAE